MKTVAAGLVAGASSVLGGRTVGAATDGERQLKIAGYDYDRVRAIMDGRVGVPDYQVVFDYQDIYSVNRYAFGPEKKYEVTELRPGGLSADS
jgi:hypothetical protein